MPPTRSRDGRVSTCRCSKATPSHLSMCAHHPTPPTGRSGHATVTYVPTDTCGPISMCMHMRIYAAWETHLRALCCLGSSICLDARRQTLSSSTPRSCALSLNRQQRRSKRSACSRQACGAKPSNRQTSRIGAVIPRATAAAAAVVDVALSANFACAWAVERPFGTCGAGLVRTGIGRHPSAGSHQSTNVTRACNRSCSQSTQSEHPEKASWRF